MKTHHFILKEDGNIYVIPEIGNAKESAILVENQEELKKAILNIYEPETCNLSWCDRKSKIPGTTGCFNQCAKYKSLKLGELYPLECEIEVRERSRYEHVYLGQARRVVEQVALITFSEPSKEVVEEPTQEELWEIVKHAYWALGEIHCEPTMGGANLSFRNRKLLIEMLGEFHERLNTYCAKHPNHDLTNRKKQK